MSEDQTDAQLPKERTAAEAITPSTAKEPATAEGAALSRKRTRDDFEEDEENAPSEPTVTQAKRSKAEESEVEKTVTEETVNSESKAEDEKKEDEVDNNKTEEPVNGANAEKESKETVDETPKSSEPTTKTEDEKEDKEEETRTTETKTSSTTPKFVFGATTPFGANAFSMVNKNKNVFDSKSSTTATKSASPGPVFGSNSKFGNAFESAIGKKNIFDKDESKDNEDKETDKERKEVSRTSSHLYKQVDVEKKEVKTGEEDEEQVFTCRAKLYALDLTNIKDGWRERGVGNVHVNKSKEDNKSSRIIMRSIGLLNVILNTALVQGLDIEKGMPSSLSSEKFIRITSVENDKPIQYAIKTGNVDTTESLYESLQDLIPKDV